MGVRSRSVQRLLARQVLIPNTPWRLGAYCAFHLSSAVLFIYLFVIFVIYDCCTTLNVSSNQLWLFIVLSFGIYCPFETCESLSVYLSTLISTRDHKKLLFPQLIQFICGRFTVSIVHHLSASLISFCVRFTDDSKALISIQTRRPRLTKHLINVVKTSELSESRRSALLSTQPGSVRNVTGVIPQRWALFQASNYRCADDGWTAGTNWENTQSLLPWQDTDSSCRSWGTENL